MPECTGAAQASYRTGIPFAVVLGPAALEKEQRSQP
jgi:hypothetical protein